MRIPQTNSDPPFGFQDTWLYIWVLLNGIVNGHRAERFRWDAATPRYELPPGKVFADGQRMLSENFRTSKHTLKGFMREALGKTGTGIYRGAFAAIWERFLELSAAARAALPAVLNT